jgi:hypothetical protein
MILSTRGGGWTQEQMSHFSQIAQGISLEPSITYFTQVGAWLIVSVCYIHSFGISIVLEQAFSKGICLMMPR